MSKHNGKPPETSTNLQAPTAFPLRKLISAGYCMKYTPCGQQQGNNKSITVMRQSVCHEISEEAILSS